MTKFFAAVFIILVINHFLPVQVQSPTRREANSTLNLVDSSLFQRQEDFNLLRRALKESHGGLYRFTDSVTLNRRFDAYRNRLKTVNNQSEFISLVSALLVEIGDGHLRLEYDPQTIDHLNQARLFPFQLMFEGRKLTVMYNETAANTDVVPGMELLSINGRKVSELIEVLMNRIPGDGYIQTGKKRRLERSFAQLYWLFVNSAAEFTIVARTQAGQRITTRVGGVLSSQRLANRTSNPANRRILEAVAPLEGLKENISLLFMDGQSTARLKIRSFDGPRFTTQLDSVFSVLNEKKTRTLVLDLRGNGGGVDEYGAALVSHFTSHPFRYFDRIWLKSIAPSFATWKPQTFETLRKGTIPAPAGGYLVTTVLHSGVGPQPSAKHVFAGPVFVLLDGRTFSTATDVTAILSVLTKAVFIGEESGGTREGNTSGLNALIKLPHSGLSLKINMYGYWNALPTNKKGRGQLPDYRVEPTMSDLLAGKDKAWEMAVTLAEKGTK